MLFEVLVRITVDVDDEDAMRAAAFALVNNAPGEEDFSRDVTQTAEAGLSVLMIHSGDIESAVKGLCSRVPGMRFKGLGSSEGDVKPAQRRDGVHRQADDKEPQTRQELDAYLTERFNGCAGWGSFGNVGAGATFSCNCGEMSGAFPMEDAQLEALQAHVKANSAARHEYVVAWRQRHSQPKS